MIMDEVKRVWGAYQVLFSADTYRVKRLVIDPGCTLSNQYHNHRKESWNVVKGEVHIEMFRPDLDTKPYTVELKEGDTYTIDKFAWHRAFNPTTEPAEVVEIWAGDQLSEDDIVRQEI